MRLITLVLINLFLFISYQSTFAQNEKKYRSKEEKAYYDSLSKKWGHKEFIPVEIGTAKKVPYNYVKVIKVDKPAVYDSKQIYSQFWDSTMFFQRESMNDYKKFDSIMQVIRNEKIGNIPKMSIIKEEKLGSKWAVLYFDSKYDDFIYGGWGYWLALSNDSGKTWKQYYTGLTENYYYFFKRNSRIPLWKDSTTLQIECTIVRQITEVVHPMPAEFETIQDSIAVQLDILKIIQDSDNDGLTDIAENKMMLNPDNPDSDKDGLIDSADKNPRFKSIKTDKTIIYETLIENFRPNEKGEMEIDMANPPVFERTKEDSMYMEFESVNIFVTDDKELQGLNLHKETMIIMTSKEYEDYRTKYPSHFIESGYTRMFKCDRKKDTYKIITSHLTSGSTFIVQKTKKGWKIFSISFWIS